jgi:hypothetical protein
MRLQDESTVQELRPICTNFEPAKSIALIIAIDRAGKTARGRMRQRIPVTDSCAVRAAASFKLGNTEPN